MLLFFAARNHQRDITSSATNHVLAAYDAASRDYVSANHHMDTLQFHAISGRDMIQKFGCRECPK